MTKPIYEALRPLLECQPYITGTEYGEFREGMLDFSTFRRFRKPGQNLAQWQAEHLGVDIRLEPWLTVSEPLHYGKVIFARSPRFHNPNFPWKDFFDKYPEALFVGTKEEFDAHRTLVGRKLKGITAPDILALAQVIAGAELVVANQTLASWLALGLGVPLIQETWPQRADAMIERENCTYIR